VQRVEQVRALRVASALALGACLALASPAGAARKPLRWYKGNTHTHSLWSDGDAPPEMAAEWYKTHGYSFLVISDHNVMLEGERWVPIGDARGQFPQPRLEALLARAGPGAVALREAEGRREMRLKGLEELRSAFEEAGRFLLIAGEEISDKLEKKPVHHGALNLKRRIDPPGGASVVEILDRTVALVEEESRRCRCPLLVHLNHPNYILAVTAEDIAAARGERFFEVYNGHRLVKNEGDSEHPSTERIWDTVLTLRLGKLGGEPLYALATDDAHDFHVPDAISNPGRGWIVVRAPSLDAAEILKAMKAGDFYASSGVVLEDVEAGRKSLTVKIAAAPGVTYTTRFIGTRVKGGDIGEAGVVLAETTGTTATYRFKGDELYVRALVVSSKPHPNGYAKTDRESAWVQPVVVRRRVAR
jgi:hypothetical protein